MCIRPDIYEERKRRAKVQHICIECHRLINKRDYYIHIQGLWEGAWGNYSMCLDCHNLTGYMLEGSDECLGIGELYEEMFNSDILISHRDNGSAKVESLDENIEVLTQSPLIVKLK